MAHLDVHLLGRPVVLVDGVAGPPPKGAKAWGLLAYLAVTGQAHPRSDLAELLFCEAVDPLGALRWNLAALRRLLRQPDALKGDLIRLHLAGAVVDIQQLERGDLEDVERAASVVLLAGLSFPDSPRFEIWLTGERARLLRRATSLLRECTLRSLAAGDYELGVRHAGVLVSGDPLDEGHHALLIRAHVLDGDAPSALAHYEHCRNVLRRELSIEPGPAVVAAAHLAAGVADASTTIDAHTIGARMAVAWQSFLAGSVDHGIDLGRTAVAMADRDDDVGMRTMARLFFAAMLNIAVRGWDEAATVTTEALHLAEQADLPYEAATARSLLAGSDLMRADYHGAATHARLGAARCDATGTRALNLAFLAAVEADVGRGAQAVALALEAVALAEESTDPISIIYATAYAGHSLLLVDDPDAARSHVERAVAVAAPVLVLLPWPLAMLAEIQVQTGDLDAATETAARAQAISSTTGSAYQQALAMRAAALVDAARGDHDLAIDRLTIALTHARRTTGEGYAFHWPIAWILHSLAEVSVDSDPDASQRWVQALGEHATAVGMHTFLPRPDHRLLGLEPDRPVPGNPTTSIHRDT